MSRPREDAQEAVTGGGAALGDGGAGSPAGGGAPAVEDPDKVKPTLFIGLFITSLLGLGVYDLTANLEENKCSMTYMYEYPEYIQIDMPEHISQKYPKYGLYAYAEGKMAEQVKSGKFSGIPVVFIPGNSGSYKQVRSMASVALRKAIDDSEYKTHFDYFSVDFSEEYSAIYGGVLELQADYLRQAIAKILSLYPKKSNKNPTSVVILGHSLGGVIAKSLFLDPQFNPSQVQVLITLSAPHTPVLIMDKHTQDFYLKVNLLWEEARSTTLRHVTLVSIGGGERDLQVRSGLTHDKFGDLNVDSTAASSVWIPTDHRCIVWCKQLVLALNRVLFDMVDSNSKQITMDFDLRSKVAHYHLYQRSGGKNYELDLHPSSLKFDINGYWSDVLKRQFTFSKVNATCNHYVMIKVNADVNNKYLTLDAVRMDNDDWVFGCKETRIYKNTRVCDQGDNLSGDSAIIPSRGKRKSIQLDMHKLKENRGYSHIVVHTPVHTEDTKVSIDLYDPRERQKSYTVPKWITFWRSYPIIEKTLPGAVYYNISLVSIDHPWQAYDIHVNPEQCAYEDPTKIHYGLARFYTPWANDTTQVLIGQGINFTNTLTAKLMSSKTSDVPADLHPQVHLYLDPACSYSVHIQASLPQMMGQLVRYYAPLILPFSSCILILILAFQMRRFETEKYCKSSLLILMAYVSPISVVLPSRAVAYVVALPFLSTYLPVTDIQLLQERGLDFGVLPILMMFGSIGIIFLSTCILWLAVIGFGSLAHKAVIAYVARMGPHEKVAELAVSSFDKFPSLLAALLVAVGFGSCGTLALGLGCFCYFLKIFKMYEEYLEGLVKRSLGVKQEDDPSLLSAVNFQLSLAMLWLMNTLLNLPVLLAYIQNIQEGGGALPTDPSLIHAVILSSSLVVLWQNEGRPDEKKKFYSACAVVLQAAAILIACYGTIAIYRIPFAISSVFIVIASHQLVAPLVEDSNEPENEETEESVENISKLKVPSSASETQDSSSGSEYEYKYQLNVNKKKIKKKKFEILKSSSQNTDTGFGEEGVDWELEQELENGDKKKN